MRLKNVKGNNLHAVKFDGFSFTARKRVSNICAKRVEFIYTWLDLSTDLFEVLLLLNTGHYIVEGVFITLRCRFNFFNAVFKILPFDARSEHIVLTKNVIAFLSQKSKLLLSI